MLSQYLRLFTQTGSTPLTDPMVDVSLKNQNDDEFSVDFNYLYIAQHYPFVNLFLLMGATINDAASKILLEYWNGTDWQAAVDVLDGSEGLVKSGMLQFSLRNNHSWCEISQTDDDSSSCPANLKGLYINNCYWLRLSFKSDGGFDVPNPQTTIKRICYAFTDTKHVNTVDKEGVSYYESLATGATTKEDWIDEIIHSSEEMVSDLKRIGFIKSAGQIIELDEVYLACAYKTLMHIYYQLGKSFNDKRAIMSNKYEKAISSKALTFDNNSDGKLDRNERNATSTKMVR